MANQGIIYYNHGSGCAARLVVSLYSLRSVYSDDIAVISDGDESNELCQKMANDASLGIQVVKPNINVKLGRNHSYLAKCRLHEHTPFDVSLYIDADTIVKGDLTHLIPLAEENEFVVSQFSKWKSNGRMISRRIRDWQHIRPRDIKPALDFGPAVNTGVMSFVKESSFMKDWFRIARKGRGFFIPDETSCQLLLHRYPNKVVDWKNNASCRYDDVEEESVKLIHYHGRKHCRAGDPMPFHGEKWVNLYREVFDKNIAGIQDWSPGGDRHLKRYLKTNSI
jgi:hypothetical protein